MWRSHYNLQALYETPTLPSAEGPAATAREQTLAILAAARNKARSVLTKAESKQILAAYGIPTVETHVATTEDDAVAAALSIGFPVVLKLHSKTITHKTDVGGIQLNSSSVEAVRDASRPIESAVGQCADAEHFQGVSVQPMVKLDGYELIIGCSLDPQFGPVLLFGAGGRLVEVFKNRVDCERRLSAPPAANLP
jgi:acetyltransferase